MTAPLSRRTDRQVSMQGMAEGSGDTAMLVGNQEMFGCTATGAHQKGVNDAFLQKSYMWQKLEPGMVTAVILQ